MNIKSGLEALGYEVIDCGEPGSDPVSRAAEYSPDLVLLDIALKDPMDGITAAKAIRERLGIPVLYPTGGTDISTITRADETVPYGYVPKPVDIPHLVSMIWTALHRNNLEKMLTESEEKFRLISENILEGVVLAVEYKIVWVNNVLADIFAFYYLPFCNTAHCRIT